MVARIFATVIFTGILSQPLFAREQQPEFYTSGDSLTEKLKTHTAGSIASSTILLVNDALNVSPTIIQMPARRAQEAMRDVQGVKCSPLMVKTAQRESDFLFSLPVAVFLTPRLYQRESDTPVSDAMLTQGQVTSLASLFNGTRQSLLLIRDRAYGDFLDGEIAKIDAQNVRFRWGGDPSSKDLLMLFKGHTHFVLTYPANVTQLEAHDDAVPLRSYEVAGAPSFTTAHYMCNKSSASAAFIERVDGVLRDLYRKPAYYQAHAAFVPSANAAQLSQAIEIISR